MEHMNELIVYCKSYNKDVNRAKVLWESVQRHNVEKLPFYISVPSEDVPLFKNTLGTDGYTLITDEEILEEKLVQSWVTQQTIKSSFWRLGLCHNYLMVDSDSFFIKSFRLKDFIFDAENHVPYTVIHEQKDLFSWTAKNIGLLGFDPQLSFAECRVAIQELFNRTGRLYDFGPGPIIWSSLVWQSLDEKYLKPNDIKLGDLINTVSSEFTWYGEWLLTDKTIPIWPIEPIFKFLHYMQEYQEYKNSGYTEEHWARNYFGIVMQSSSGLPLRY
jgi:hypothetical protein